jgi:hypothetical protein
LRQRVEPIIRGLLGIILRVQLLVPRQIAVDLYLCRELCNFCLMPKLVAVRP